MSITIQGRAKKMHPKLGTKTFRVWVIIPLFLLFMTTGVKAESITQTITLSPGWNAIFLEVEPDNGPLPADVFGSILDPIIPDLISVWTWNPNTGTVEFIQNSEEVIPDQRNMLVYYTDPPPALESTMNSVPGNKAYLLSLIHI